MTLRKAIKFNAKKSLKGNWGKAILILLICTAIGILLNILDNAIFSALGFQHVKITGDLLRGDVIYQFGEKVGWPEALLSLLLSLVRLCIMAPLTLGVANWALELTDGRTRPVGDIFWAFDNAAIYRSIWMEITVSVKVGLFSALIMLIPGAMMGYGAAIFYDNRSLSVLLYALGGLLMLAAIPFELWFSARYFATRLLLCDRYYYTVREATKLSVELTRGRRWQIVGFYLSFLPWFLLCCLVLPIFYVLPYFAVASVMYARYLFEDHLLGQRKLDVSDPDRIIIDDVAPEDYHTARTAQGLSEEAPAEEKPYAGAEPTGTDGAGEEPAPADQGAESDVAEL